MSLHMSDIEVMSCGTDSFGCCHARVSWFQLLALELSRAIMCLIKLYGL
jgi:hypothetical protein